MGVLGPCTVPITSEIGGWYQNGYPNGDNFLEAAVYAWYAAPFYYYNADLDAESTEDCLGFYSSSGGGSLPCGYAG